MMRYKCTANTPLRKRGTRHLSTKCVGRTQTRLPRPQQSASSTLNVMSISQRRTHTLEQFKRQLLRRTGAFAAAKMGPLNNSQH